MASVSAYTKTQTDLTFARRQGNRVALLGDSITDFNTDLTGYPNIVQYTARGFFTWANILLRQRFTLVTPSNTDGAWGQSGETAYTILNGGDAASAAASTSDIVIVLAGTNDLTDAANFTAAQIAANLLAIWNIQIQAGKRVVACTIMPRNNSDTAAVTQKLRDTNRLIRKNAAATPGVSLCDWYAVTLDPATNLAKSGTYYIDGIHPNSVGASRYGAALAPVLDRLAPPGADDLALDGGDTAQYLPNPLMTGTGGFASNSATIYAASWSCYESGATITGSKVPRTDLNPGEWQQVVIPAGGGNFTLQNYVSVGGANQPAVGDVLYATTEFETDPTGFAGTQLSMMIEFNGSTNQSRAPQFAEQLLIQRPPSGILRTPPIPVPTGATLVKVDLTAYGPGTYRFGRTQLTKLL